MSDLDEEVRRVIEFPLQRTFTGVPYTDTGSDGSGGGFPCKACSSRTSRAATPAS
jgi:hypothetical protein